MIRPTSISAFLAYLGELRMVLTWYNWTRSVRYLEIGWQAWSGMAVEGKHE
jgi:hypothetical protein